MLRRRHPLTTWHQANCAECIAKNAPPAVARLEPPPARSPGGDREAEVAELDRRIADLRAFERDYRARLIAHLQHCLALLDAD